MANAAAGPIEPSARKMYHEKQWLQRCGVHALNNLLQGKLFSKKGLDDICYSLSPDSWINPHKSVLGTGNYDVNVLMSALQQVDLSVTWFDHRKDVTTVNLEALLGVLVNRRSSLLGVWTSHHWLALRRFPAERLATGIGAGGPAVKPQPSVFVNLDSGLSEPRPFERHEQVYEFLASHLRDRGHVLLVHQEEDRARLYRERRFEPETRYVPEEKGGRGKGGEKMGKPELKEQPRGDPPSAEKNAAKDKGRDHVPREAAGGGRAGGAKNGSAGGPAAKGRATPS